MPPLTDAQQAFIRDNKFFAVATTIRPDGSPHSTVVWVDEEDGDVVINTTVERTKGRNLAANPDIAITVVDASGGYRWLSVSGKARLDTSDGVEVINRLSHRYDGGDFPVRPGTRVTVRVTPDQIDSLGIDG